jgi:DNA-directed RNA polymerase specialized sigma24 family protein
VITSQFAKKPGPNEMGDHMKNTYSGHVEMYDEKIYIDMATKQGYARVLERIDPLLCKWSSRTYLPGYTYEDIKQELSIIIVEGINAYNYKKKVKLSTFLHTHLRNKLISKIKSVNKLSNDASSLRGPSVAEGEDEGPKYRRSREELSFSTMAKKDPNSGEEYCEFQNTLSNSDSLYSEDGTVFERIDLELAIEKVAAIVDEKTYTILRRVCLDGYSIKDAAGEVGLTGWAASMRLKKLSKHKLVTDMLGDSIVRDE